MQLSTIFMNKFNALGLLTGLFVKYNLETQHRNHVILQID